MKPIRNKNFAATTAALSAAWRTILGLWLAVALLLGPVRAAEPSGPQLTRLTHDGRYKQRPKWSPDGQRLSFTRFGGAEIFLYVVAADGTQERRLTERTDPEFDAAWSPDGKRLAFCFDKVSPCQGDIEVYTVSVDGKDLQPVALSEGKLSHEEWPAWSPDGQWIAYTSTRDDNQEIYLAKPDGGEKKRLTSDPGLDLHPCWSRDGTKIAFATDRWGDLELALLDVETGKVTRLTHSPGLDDYPAWSPDGRTIAFTSNRDRNLEIYLIDPDGGRPRNATQSQAVENYPSWTPDGRLTFISNRDGGFEIYVTTRSTSEGAFP